jgi:hypothetical protein
LTVFTFTFAGSGTICVWPSRPVAPDEPMVCAPNFSDRPIHSCASRGRSYSSDAPRNRPRSLPSTEPPLWVVSVTALLLVLSKMNCHPPELLTVRDERLFEVTFVPLEEAPSALTSEWRPTAPSPYKVDSGVGLLCDSELETNIHSDCPTATQSAIAWLSRPTVAALRSGAGGRSPRYRSEVDDRHTRRPFALC